MRSFNALAIRDYYPDVKNPGNSLWVYEQVLELQKRGIDSLVISPTPYIPQFMRLQKRFRLYPALSNTVNEYKNTLVIRPGYLKLPAGLRQLNMVFLEHCINKSGQGLDPKFIHAHFGRNGVASLSLKRKLKVPLVTLFYGDDVGIAGHAEYLSRLYSSLVNEGDLFIALSMDMREDMLNLGFPHDKTIVHHLGVNTDVYKPVKPAHNKDVFTFTTIGRFHKFKGGQDAISAFNIVQEKLKNTELRIVGDGSYLDQLRKLVASLKLENKVRFINNFISPDPRQTVFDELDRCDVFLLPTFQDDTGMKTGTPVVLMEAQALGKPCISTRYAGIPEVVNENVSGYLIKQRDVEDLSAKMMFLYSNAQERQAMGQAARKHIVEKFNLSTQMDKLAEIYNNLR